MIYNEIKTSKFKGYRGIRMSNLVHKKIRYISILLAVLLLSGCATMNFGKTTEEVSMVYDLSSEKVIRLLEDILKVKTASFRSFPEGEDTTIYTAETGAKLDMSAAFFVKANTRLTIRVLRVQSKTRVVITAQSNAPILPTDAKILPRNILDDLKTRVAEEIALYAPQNGQGEAISQPVVLISDVDKDIPKTNIQNPNSIAIVIGNRDYKNKDIPSVDYAMNDAEAIKRYLINVLGYKEGNIIHKENAGKADFESLFGTNDDHKGRLFNYLKDGVSDIFVYYSGHGAPDIENKKGYFVPADADPQTIKLTGYSLDTFYKNLSKIVKDKKIPNVYIVIEACFSGSTEKGLLMKNMSPIVIQVDEPTATVPNSVVLTSSSGSEVSSWYPEKGHSMFTYFFLKALKESVEKGKPTVTADALFKSVTDEAEGLPYYTRRLHGRIQTPQIMGDKNKILFKK